MKRKRSIILIATKLVMLFATPTKAQHTTDSLAIQAILPEEVSSWNRGDAQVYSKHFADDGTFTNIRGMFATGYKHFLDRHVEIFKGIFFNTVLQQHVVCFRFLNPDVAIVETLTWISQFPNGNLPKAIHIDSKGRLHTRLLQVFQKRGDNWKIVVYHNVDLKPDAPVPPHQ